MDKKYILLLGEGNFLYSASLITDPDLPFKIIATDFKPPTFPSPSGDELTLKNIHTVESHGGIVLTDVDATNIQNHTRLQTYKDSIIKIIFNFPHVQTRKMHVGLNRDLLKEFFISASQFISMTIPVQVSLCSGQSGINEIETSKRIWSDSWQIVEQAAYGNFVLENIQPFKAPEFYKNSGFQDKSNLSFNADDSNTFTFTLREPLLLPEYAAAESENLPFLEMDFSQIQDSNPLKKLVELLNLLPSNLRIEIDYEAEDIPFFNVFADNLLIDDTLKILPFLKLIELDSGDNNVNEKIIFIMFNGTKVGCINNTIIGLNLSKIVTIQNGITDPRILFSKYCVQDKQGNFSTCSLYPREHIFDISFWIKPDFSYKDFLHCALMTYGLTLKSVKLIDIYESVLIDEDKKTSHGYRVAVQSTDLAMTRILANEFQVLFRQILSNKLKYEVT